MDTAAIRTDLNKALALVAKKHGVQFDMQTTGVADESAQFTLTMGEEMSRDMREYLALTNEKMKAGHNYFKRKFPGLSDQMLGKRFVVYGKAYVYLGCQTSRPSYPVSACEVKLGGYRQIKCPLSFLEQMIKQYEREVGKQRHQEIKSNLNRVDPELAAEANFS